ncbi:MAG: type II toxin-antitoxin system RelE/ParE family toxin [Flavobacteriales bacterium]|nr:MAG: type II toxin-antitoxin system RelE/ParE family toxin [Flavobacteriales bacterium]
MKRLVIGPDAEADLRQAVLWYADQREGLEQRFIDEFDEFTRAILLFPRGAPLITDHIRMMPMRVFKHVITYTVDGDQVVILRVVHGSRHPRQRTRGRKRI